MGGLTITGLAPLASLPALAPLLALLAGWLADRLLGDPPRLPHPVVGFGRLISAGERALNRGSHRATKGGVLAIGLVAAAIAAVWGLRQILAPSLWAVAAAALIFYSLAGTTLVREVREVFAAADRSLDEGRRRVARIVGRDTANLTAREIRTAALETLAENLSDGVVAPLFWLAVGGVPAMVGYKMVNTLDSMIGYRTARYVLFGRVAARVDDAANWIPARLTAALMVLAAGLPGLAAGRPAAPGRLRRRDLWRFVRRFGRAHASPNAGWPEAALAGVLDCRFGGAHDYHGERIDKPYIGTRARELTSADARLAIRLNRRVEVIAIILVSLRMLAG